MPKKTVWFSPTKIIPSIPEADRPVIERLDFSFGLKTRHYNACTKPWAGTLNR